MRNATLSVLWVLLLVASTAAAQTDETVDSGGAEEVAPEAADSDAADGSVLEAGAAADAAADATGEEGSESAEEPSSAPVERASESLGAPDAVSEESTSESGADETEAAAEEEEGAPAAEPLPWRNTFFSWTHQATFNSFFRDSQLSYNPYYGQSFGLTPRWYLAPTSYFLISQSLGIEITDTDGGVYNREPMLSDTVIEFRQSLLWEGFLFMGQARIALPVSKASQAAQRYLQAGLGLNIVRPIPEINLTLAGSFAYRTWLAGSNVVRTGAPQPDNCAPGPNTVGNVGTGDVAFPATYCDQLGTSSAARDTMVAGLTAIFNFDELSIAAQYVFVNAYGYELAPAYVNVATREEPLMIADGSPSHWRNFNYFGISVGYQFAPWINVSIGIQNSVGQASAYNPDGSIRNPIFTPDTSVYLSASMQLDTIYQEIAGGADDGLTPEERQRRRQGLAAGPASGAVF